MPLRDVNLEVMGRGLVPLLCYLWELCFSLVSPLWGFCCSLVLPIKGTRLGNVFGGGWGGNASEGNLISPAFSIIPVLPSFLPIPLFSLSSSPSFSLSHFLYLCHLFSLSLLLSLSLSPLLSLSCGFCLNWVLAM